MRNKILVSVLSLFSIVSATDVSGVISSNTTWSTSGSPYIATGNVLVNSGVTLTIEPGVTVKFNDGKLLQNKGTLIAQGNSGNRITFTSNQISPAAGDWGSIDFESDMTASTYDGSDNYTGGSILEYVDVLYAGGTEYEGAVNIRSTDLYINQISVKYSASYGINMEKSTTSSVGLTKIENSTISDNGGTGIYCQGYQYNIQITVNNCTVQNNQGGGISTGSGDHGGTHIFKHTNNLVTGNSGTGISAMANGTQTVEDNIISSNTGNGIRLRGNGTYTVNRNIVVNNSNVGIHGIYTTHYIKYNVVANNAGGIEISQGGGYTINNNLIYNNNNNGDGSGFDPEYGSEQGAWSPSVTIKNNTFTSNTSTNATILSFQPESGDPTFTADSNNIFNNIAAYEIKNLRNSSLSNIDAEDNYWGTSSESTIQSKIYDWFDDGSVGIVDYTPYATSPNTFAPISPPGNVAKQISGNNVILTWDANPESDVAGYKIHYGNFTGYSYTTNTDLGNVTTYTLSGVSIDSSIAVTAYDGNIDGTDDQVEGY